MDVCLKSISDNVAEVKQRITNAAQRSGRSAEDVKLIAVSKYVGEREIRALVDAGCDSLGENRPQAFWEKTEQLADLPIEWHFIGNLQRNKVRRTMPHISLLHSVDSLKLLKSINDLGNELSRMFAVLLEVNISGDANKHGFSSNDLEEILTADATMDSVNVKGLMGMASLVGGTDQANRDFESLRVVREQLIASGMRAEQLQELSMGMSGDFEAAIEQGSTMVRIGSLLFK